MTNFSSSIPLFSGQSPQSFIDTMNFATSNVAILSPALSHTPSYYSYHYKRYSKRYW